MSKTLFDLTGKKAIVIGGAGGIGSSIAKGLAMAGADVAIASRDESKLSKTAESIKKEIGAEIKYYVVDVSSEESVKSLADKFVADNGRVDILVNSQGYNKKYPAFEHPMDEWDKMYDVNIRSIMLTCKYFGKYMADQGGGRVINVSSIGAIRTKASDDSVAYCSTKGAVDTLTTTLAAGWGQHRITVNAIAPILTETEMMKPIFEAKPNLLKDTIARVPLGRAAQPDDAIAPAVFFASDDAGFVTGQIIYLDGGLKTLQ
jgi:gluconate 5-dehydrogenase